MRRSSLLRQARQGRARRRTLADLDAEMRTRFPGLPPDIRTVEEIQEAQDQADLAAAAAWGYSPAEPETLDLAIAALDSASVVRRDPYSDSTCRGDELRAQEAGDLARRLKAIREKQP